MTVDGLIEEYQDWQLIGEAYFSKHKLYDLKWDQNASKPGSTFSLDHMRSYAASFGGPIACYRDERKVVLHLGSVARPDIFIYSASSNRLARILWDKGRIATAGWVGHEQLIVVEDRGYAHRFSALGLANQGEPFSLGRSVESEGLELVEVFNNGIVALTPSGHLWCVPDVSEPRAQHYPDPAPTGGDIHCLLPIPPHLSPSGALEILVAVEHTLMLVDANEATPTPVFEGPIVKLSLSPDGKHVAGFAADSTLHIWTLDLEEVVTKVGIWETSEDAADVLGIENAPDGFPDSMVWCGSDAIAVFWEGTGLLLITLEGGWRWWDVGSGAVILVSEMDGVRVVSNEAHWLLRKVPQPIVGVLESGSTSPGALLFDARRLYESRDARAAAELLEVLHAGDLPTAVATCLLAAAAELEPQKQEALMQAGCYGRAFLALQDGGTTRLAGLSREAKQVLSAKHAVEIARKLRVLNALREEGIAMPLTAQQFDRLGVNALVTRLVGRRCYLLALRICETLMTSPENVLLSWACDKIAASAASIPDDELVQALRSKLDGRPGVKWARIASHAQNQGRRTLATALLEHERRAVDQVPLLLELGEEERALSKAITSGDGDLIFQVVYCMWKKLERAAPGGSSSQKFWSIIRSSPAATAILAKYFVCQGGDLQESMFMSLNDHGGLADLRLVGVLRDAAGNEATESQIQKELTRVKDEYNKAAGATTDKMGRDFRADAAAATQLSRLRELQTNIQSTSGREGFVGLSVIETIRHCLRLGLKEQAQKLGREFKVPEKQFLVLSINTFASSHDWQALQHMAGKLDRKAPITMEHFISACRAYGAPVPIIRWFADKLVGDNAIVRKAQIYFELGLRTEATMLAEQAELQGVGSGVLGSLRDAMGGTFGTLLNRNA